MPKNNLYSVTIQNNFSSQDQLDYSIERASVFG